MIISIQIKVYSDKGILSIFNHEIGVSEDYSDIEFTKFIERVSKYGLIIKKRKNVICYPKHQISKIELIK